MFRCNCVLTRGNLKVSNKKNIYLKVICIARRHDLTDVQLETLQKIRDIRLII